MTDRRSIGSLSDVARMQHWSSKVEIKDGTVDGFIEILVVYGRNLEALSDLWMGLSMDDEEDDVPPDVWVTDSKPVRQLSKTLIDCSKGLQSIWSSMPVDLREIVDIKVRKVKQIERDK